MAADEICLNREQLVEGDKASPQEGFPERKNDQIKHNQSCLLGFPWLT